ncbi:MAG: GPW/gp25 family protein [bacterium]|nr:GPW/gp25 family protein [bacterium]
MSEDSSSGKGFLGAGVGFPLRLDDDGHLAVSRLEDQVRQSILLILRTARGERVMRPDFGVGLEELVFEPLNQATIALVEHRVTEALIRFEPRVDVLGVDVRADSEQRGVLLIELDYRVRRTDTQFNLVYPFYLERGAL